MNKRGLGHVEVILAFIIFLGFVSFMFYFLTVRPDSRALEQTVVRASQEIRKNVSVTFEQYSIKVSPVSQGNIFPDWIEISFDEGSLINKNPAAVNYSGLRLTTVKRGNVVYIKPESNSFIYLRLSEDIDESGAGNFPQTTPNEFTTVSVLNRATLLSEKRLVRLKVEYETNYAALKDKLGIARTLDFAFSVNFSKNDLIVAQPLPGSSTFEDGDMKYVYEERVEILRTDGAVQYAVIRVSIW